MYIDVVHFLLACCVVVTLMSAVMLLVWLQDRSATWLLWVSGIFVFGGISMILLMSDGSIPRPLSVGLGTTTFIIGFFTVWTAGRVSQGKAPFWPALVASLSLWNTLCLIPGVLDGLLAAAIVHCVLGSVMVGLGTYEFWRGRGDRLGSRWALIVFFGCIALSFGVRLPFIAIMPFPFGAQPPQFDWVAFFVLSLVSAGFLLAVLCVLFAKSRAELELRRFALTDALTALPNRRAYAVDVAKVARRHADGVREYCLVMLDLDHFKSINDERGHDFGDRVLARFADAAGKCLREGDALYRLGGEEFCCILPHTDVAGARRVADNMRLAFRTAVRDLGDDEFSATVSGGIASSRHAGPDPAELQNQADAALYRAKRMGRDRIVAGQERLLPDDDVVWLAA